MNKRNREWARKRRHRSVRLRVHGTGQRPRLNVFRSLVHIHAQIIDDTVGHTIASASTLDSDVRKQLKGLSKSEQANVVGTVLARRALEKGVQQVVFDRGGYKYHGRVKALADGARSAGLLF